MIRHSRRLLDAFNDWFVSDGGVWQTFAVTLAIVVFEEVFPHFDPDHFIVLYALTVYSGITQPALARAGRVAGERQEQMLARLATLEEQLAALVGTVAAGESEEAALVREIHQRIVAGNRADATLAQNISDLAEVTRAALSARSAPGGKQDADRM